MIEVLLFGYLLGAIPFGWIVYRHHTGGDVRQAGSGNIGATNILRTLGARAGGSVLLADCLKGVVAVLYAFQVYDRGGFAIGTGRVEAGLLAGVAAMIGHMFPVYIGFKGGKGVATALGIFIPVAPWPLLGSVLVFAVIVGLTRFVSLGSMLGAACLPVFVWLSQPGETVLLIMSWLVVAFILIRHRKNFARLMAGTESRIEWKSREGKRN